MWKQSVSARRLLDQARATSMRVTHRTDRNLLWALGSVSWMFAACAQILGIEDLPPLADLDGAPRDTMSPNPADAALPCLPACVGDELRLCQPERWLACPFGCDAERLACAEQWLPSNGARRQHLEGVSAGIHISEGALAYLQTDTGELITDSVPQREPGEGIVDGIGFFNLDDSISLMAVTDLAVYGGASLRALGTRAVILVSAGNVYIEGVIDISVFRCDGLDRPARCGGPGGGTGGRILDDAPSVAATGCAPGDNGRAGGGGALGGSGGPGGGGTLGGAGGMHDLCPGPALVPLRGGSGGGGGGDAGLGTGGGGGGAIQVTSFTSIVITGPSGATPAGIVAAGGGGGGSNGGGGGGGGGGGILLEAPSIILRNALLAANGGGGGGAGSGTATAGQDGPASATRASGGTGSSAGGTGGALEGAAGPGQDGPAPGGGGGGAGLIRLNVPEPGLLVEDAIISPMFTRGELPEG